MNRRPKLNLVDMATLDHHNRKKTDIKIPGGGAAIGAVLVLGGALATAAFVRKIGWNRRRCLQDQKNADQDGSFGPTDTSIVPSGAEQGIEGGTELIDGCDRESLERSLGPAVLGNDAVSVATTENETLRVDTENMMNGGEVKITLIKEDHVSDEVEITETNNFVLDYDGDVEETEARQSEEKGLGVLYIESGEKCGKIEDHGSDGDEKEHATEGDGRVENELVNDEERFGQDGDDVGPKEELVAVAEENTPCEEDIAIQIAAESPVMEPLMNGDLHLLTSNEIGFDNKEAEEDLTLPDNDEDEVEEEEPVKESNVVGLVKQHEDNVERDTVDEVKKAKSAIADDISMRMSGNTNNEESSVETSDSWTDIQHTSGETSDSYTDTQHLPHVVIEDSSAETGGSSIDETIPPPEPLHMPCQEQMAIREVEGKILDDAAVKAKALDGDGLPKKRLIKKYTVELVKLKAQPMRKAVAVGSVWLWFSWFFGPSFVKLCTILVLTIVLSKIQSYCVGKWAKLKRVCPTLVANAIEKLPLGWKDLKSYLKHKHKKMNMERLMVKLLIEEDNLTNDMRNMIPAVKANVCSGSRSSLQSCSKPKAIKKEAISATETDRWVWKTPV